ncbi:MAG: Dabb family protein [Bacteroidota bacterium]
MQKFYLVLLILSISLFSCQDTSQLETQIADLEAQLSETKAQLSEAQANIQEEGKFIHTVFFWMKEDMSEEEREQFESGLQSLSEIESVKEFYWGEPADSEKRAVVDNSYDYALIIHFEDLAGHDAYQPHDIHQTFVANSSELFKEVKVYDSLVE